MNFMLSLFAVVASLALVCLIYIAMSLGPCFYWFQVGEHKMYLSAYNQAQTYFTKNKKQISDTHFVCELKGWPYVKANR